MSRSSAAGVCSLMARARAECVENYSRRRSNWSKVEVDKLQIGEGGRPGFLARDGRPIQWAMSCTGIYREVVVD